MVDEVFEIVIDGSELSLSLSLDGTGSFGAGVDVDVRIPFEDVQFHDQNTGLGGGGFWLLHISRPTMHSSHHTHTVS